MNDYSQCDDCHEFKPDARYTTCPYMQDIYGEIEECILCDDCEYARCMEI